MNGNCKTKLCVHASDDQSGLVEGKTTTKLIKKHRNFLNKNEVLMLFIGLFS